MQVVQEFEARHGQTPLSNLVVWAAWAIESLQYLDHLDEIQGGYPAPIHGHSADVIDIAHVRWATSTAITALDLCAGALGRFCCGWAKPRELDLRHFDPAKTGMEKIAKKQRAKLPSAALAWVDQVLTDTRYIDIQGARNPFTHSWLRRRLSRGGPGSHAERTQFVVEAHQPAQPDRVYGARALVTLARDLGTSYVDAFVRVIATL
jgi:hypothetical protein